MTILNSKKINVLLVLAIMSFLLMNSFIISEAKNMKGKDNSPSSKSDLVSDSEVNESEKVGEQMAEISRDVSPKAKKEKPELKLSKGDEIQSRGYGDCAFDGVWYWAGEWEHCSYCPPRHRNCQCQSDGSWQYCY